MALDETKRVATDNLVYHDTSNMKALFDDGAEPHAEDVWTLKIKPRVKEWLDENIKGTYTVTEQFFHFDTEEDAMAFKLRWT